jgi:hypothetical protein
MLWPLLINGVLNCKNQPLQVFKIDFSFLEFQGLQKSHMHCLVSWKDLLLVRKKLLVILDKEVGEKEVQMLR